MKRKILLLILKYSEIIAWWAKKKLYVQPDFHVVRARSYRRPRLRT